MSPVVPSRFASASAPAIGWAASGLACRVAGAGVVHLEVSQIKRPFRPLANPLVVTP